MEQALSLAVLLASEQCKIHQDVIRQELEDNNSFFGPNGLWSINIGTFEER
jgi:hypothetical protein